ncbi:MAG: hypothetical protein DRG50_02405 [Deltaproteobacteria bacterium]|nr:MAG: hypothetical protein DRG50_02405 [Deltaproteobacteria bacterium]
MKNKVGQFNRKGNKVISIAKIAAKLFSTRGYLETSMDEIAAAAKISKGGIYHYFTSKVEILYFILNNYMDLVLGDLEEELKGVEGDFAKIKYIISRHIDLYVRNVYEAKTLLHEAHNLPPKSFKIIAEKERRYYQIVAGVLQSCLGASVEKDKVTAVAFTLFGMCNWIYSWYNSKGPVTPQQLSKIIFGIFTNGVSNLQDDGGRSYP